MFQISKDLIEKKQRYGHPKLDRRLNKPCFLLGSREYVSPRIVAVLFEAMFGFGKI